MQEHVFTVQTLTRAGLWIIPRQPPVPRHMERRHTAARKTESPTYHGWAYVGDKQCTYIKSGASGWFDPRA